MKQAIEELNQLEISDIKQKIAAFEKELYALKRQAQTSRVDKPHKFKELKKQIARCKTIIREKELVNARRA